MIDIDKLEALAKTEVYWDENPDWLTPATILQLCAEIRRLKCCGSCKHFHPFDYCRRDTSKKPMFRENTCDRWEALP